MIFTASGIVVVPPDPKQDPYWDRRGDKFGISKFEGRIPLAYDERKRHLYMGAPDWFHDDLYDHHGISRHDAAYLEGMVAGGPEWADGHLKWFSGNEPEEHTEIADALEEAGVTVPNKEPSPMEDMVNPFAEIPFGHGDPTDDLWRESGVKGFKKWWKLKGPATVSNAERLAEYACLEHMTREDCQDFLDEHEDEISEPDRFRRRFFRKFDLFC